MRPKVDLAGPASLDAERATLGAVLIDPAVYATVGELLLPDDFSHKAHVSIFAAMFWLARNGQGIDPVTLVDRLISRGELEVAGGALYIADLTAGLPRSTNAKYYAEIVRRDSTRRRLYNFANSLSGQALNSGDRDVSELLEAAQLSLRLLSERHIGSQNGAGFRVGKLGDLLNEPEERTPCLVDGMLVSGGTSLILAKPKAGKSTLARGLCFCVAKGLPWLGRNTAQGPVVYLGLEEKRAEVRKHFADLGVNGDEPIFVHAGHAPQQAIAATRKVIAEQKPVLLVVDPVQRLVRLEDGNDYTEVTAALEPIVVLAQESGAHIALVHHLGKSERNEASDAVLGSTAFFAAVDTAVFLKKTDRCRTILTVQRYGEDMPETILEFDPIRRAVSLGLPRDEADRIRIEAAILAHLEKAGEQTATEIASAVEGRTATVKATINLLSCSQRILFSGTGKKGDARAYRLPSTHAVPAVPAVPL